MFWVYVFVCVDYSVRGRRRTRTLCRCVSYAATVTQKSENLRGTTSVSCCLWPFDPRQWAGGIVQLSRPQMSNITEITTLQPDWNCNDPISCARFSMEWSCKSSLLNHRHLPRMLTNPSKSHHASRHGKQIFTMGAAIVFVDARSHLEQRSSSSSSSYTIISFKSRAKLCQANRIHPQFNSSQLRSGDHY